MQLDEEILRVWEELFLPGVSGPAYTLAEFVFLVFGLELGPGLVPVHVDNHHIHRDAVGLEGSGEVHKLIIRVLPVTAPPVAEGVFRRERNAAGHLHKVAEGGGVVVSVSEEIQVFRLLVLTADNPSVPVFFDFFIDRAAAFIDHGPAGAGDNSLLERVIMGRMLHHVEAPAAIQGPGCAEKVPGVRVTVVPTGLFACEFEGYCQGLWGEFASAIVQSEVFCLDYHAFALLLYGILRDRKAAVDNSQGGPVFEAGVRRPLHPYHSGSEDGETGIAADYYSLRICKRIRGIRVCKEACRDTKQQKRYGRKFSHMKDCYQLSQVLPNPLHPGSVDGVAPVVPVAWLRLVVVAPRRCPQGHITLSASGVVGVEG